MIITTTWPNKDLLPVPDNTYKEIINQLTEGFESENTAKQYWQEIPTVLIHLTAEDGPTSTSTATEETQQQIQFALSYPEFVVPIGEEYQLALAVFSDEGSGIYLLIHNDCPLCEGLADA